jgi:putative NIF3 family GTP cyclohydrolase 1 type 2
VTGAVVTAIGACSAALDDAAPLGVRALFFPHALIAEETARAASTPRHALIAMMARRRTYFDSVFL